MTSVNKSNQEKLKEMIEMQSEYDDAIYESFETEFDADKCLLALFDELGEVNHELKALWCYWKHSQRPVYEEYLLEELADCWHFGVSYYYNMVEPEDFERDFELLFHYHITNRPKSSIRKSLSWYLRALERVASPTGAFDILDSLYEICLWCGFEFDDIYEAFKRKNDIIWERLREGY